jgi:hypothetical protein
LCITKPSVHNHPLHFVMRHQNILNMSKSVTRLNVRTTLISSTIEEKVLSDHEQNEFWNEGNCHATPS